MMSHYDWNAPTGGSLGCAVAFLIYFLPSIVAFSRRHHNRMAIFVLNLFLGLSGLGWVIALIWAFTVVQNSNKSV